ncbi:MAG: ABZJ_00895 family protein [Pseudomonadota bacterium]
MTDTQILTRFAVVTLIVFAAVMAISALLQIAFQYEAGSGLGIVTIIVPAMEAGQTQARRTGQAMPGGRMWRLSLLFGLVGLVLSSALAFGAAAVMGSGALATALADADLGLMAVMTVIILVVYILAARFFLAFGQRLELNRAK